MSNICKNKGVTLVELMVALSLGVLLMFSMLAFYSITQQNLTTYIVANKEQQEQRKIIQLISRNIVNTGAFECAPKTSIFRAPWSLSQDSGLKINRTDIKRFPREIISLGEFARADRQQFIFVHPISEELLDRSLGLMDVQVFNKGNSNEKAIAHYSPVEIQANCGAEESTIYIGSTIIETAPLTPKKLPPITEFKNTASDADGVRATGVNAFIVMSGLQPRLQYMDIANPTNNDLTDFRRILTDDYDRAYFRRKFRKYGGVDMRFTSGVASEFHRNASGTTNTGKDMYSFAYLPSIYDGTVGYLSNSDDITNLPFGKNNVEILLGFANSKHSSSIPSQTMSSLSSGGWLSPYTNEDDYNSIVDKSLSDTDAQLINRVLHDKDIDSIGYNMKTYPLNEKAAEQVRAVKFIFTLDAGTDKEKVITRVVRFKNIYLRKLDDNAVTP